MDILMVDDERMLLEQAKIFLEKRNEEFEIEPATSAEKALKKLEEEDYDVVVSDYQMPETDGLEFLEEIREERENDIPFIMFTGKGREEVAMKALNLGGDRYMQKGGDPKSQYGVLAQAIEQEYKHHRTEKERESYTRELEFLNDLMMNIGRTESTDDICEYVADKVHSINEEDYVIISLYDQEKETIRIRAIAGFEDHPQLVDDFLRSGKERTFDPDKLGRESDIDISGKLKPMPEGLYSLVKGVLSKEEAGKIEELLGVKKVYSVPFSLDDKPFGSLSILKTSEEGVKFKSAIEGIANHLSVTLQRRVYREKSRTRKDKIKESEERYRRLFETAQDGMLIIDAETGVIEDANPFIQDILGYSKEELVGKELWELGTFESIIENKRRLEELVEEGYIRYEDKPLVSKDGDEVPVEFVSNTYEAGGKKVVQCNIREISERKESKEGLKQKEKILDHTPTHINVIDEEGNIKYHSYPSNEVKGLNPSELMGSEGIEYVHPEDREKTLEMFSKVMEDPGEEHTIELRGEAEDGWIWLEVRAVNHLDDPEINGIIVSAQDISARKEMEKDLHKKKERLDLALQGAELGVWDWDVKTDEVRYDEGWAEMLGYSLDEIDQDLDAWEKRVHPDERARVKEELEKHLEGKVDIYKTEHRMKTKSGDWIWVEDVGKVFERDENGEPVRATGILEDITDRKRSEQKLKESKSRLNRSQKIANIGSWEIDLETDELTWSEETYRIFEIPKDKKMDYQDFLDKIHPEDRDYVDEEWQKALEEGTGYDIEHRIITDGKTKWVREKAEVDLDEEEKPVEVIGSVQDITEQKEREQELKDREEKYRTIFESANDAIFIMKKDRYIDCNEKALEIFGCDREELLEKTPYEFSPEKQPDGRDSKEKAMEKINSALEGEGQNFEWVHTTKDGEPFYTDITLNRYISNDERFLMVMARDITEKKEKEERLSRERKKFSNIFNNVNDAIYLHDLTEEGMPGKFIEVNETATEMLGYSREEFLEMSPMEIDAGEQANELPDVMDELVDKGEIKFEMVHEAKDGTKIPVEIHSHIVEFEGEKRVLSVARDVTERKEAERRLKKSERRFRRIFEASPDPTFLLDEEGVFRDVNKAVLKKLGYDKEDITGKTLKEVPFLEGKAVEKTLKNFKRRKKGEDVPPYEVEMVSKDGERMYGEINVGIFEENGFEGEVVIARDITERKMVEKEREELLHDLKERYKELDLLYGITRLGTETSKTLEDVLEETVEMIPPGWQYPEVTEAKITFDGKEYQTDGFEKTDHCLKSAIESGDEKIGDITVCYTEEKPDVDIGPFLEEEKDLIGAIGTVISNLVQKKESERKLEESEERYRTLVESSFAGISITDFDNNFTFVNDRFAEMLGYEKEELVGKNIEDVAPEEELHKFEQETEKRKKREISQYESRLKKKSGEKIDVMVHASPYKNAAGDFVGTMGVVSDITDVKETQEREELLNSLLRHDVLNKAQVIQGYLQLLEAEDVSEDTRRYIEKSKEANKESINLIQKIRLLLSAQKEEQEPVEIESTIHEAVGEVEALIQDKEIDLSLKCPSMKCKVKGGSLLKEVFSNLMENSVYHSEGSKVKVSGEVKDDEVVCTVEDDGKGIPDDKKEVIFEKGYTTDDERGTGLGLFLVKMLLESYDGKIDVKDSELGGARFDVKLERAG